MKKCSILLVVLLAVVIMLAVPMYNRVQYWGSWQTAAVDMWKAVSPWGDKAINYDAEKGQLLIQHNEQREHNQLMPLVAEERLSTAAQKHANYMAKISRLSHFGEDWGMASSRAEAEGYEYFRIGENIAAGQTSVNEVMLDWMESPGHRKNILGKYTEVGIGIAYGRDGRMYWCVVFGKPT